VLTQRSEIARRRMLESYFDYFEVFSSLSRAANSVSPSNTRKTANWDPTFLRLSCAAPLYHLLRLSWTSSTEKETTTTVLVRGLSFTKEKISRRTSLSLSVEEDNDFGTASPQASYVLEVFAN
jgi:hypothetical protein